MGIVRHTVMLIPVVVIVFLLTVVLGARFWTDLLWFEVLGFESIFWIRFAWQWGIKVGAVVLCAAFMFLNLSVARSVLGKPEPEKIQSDERWHLVQVMKSRWTTWVIVAVSVLFGIVSSTGLTDLWQDILLYIKGTPYGAVDPLFKKDISYYFFALPFFQDLYQVLQGLLLINFLAASLLYLITGVVHFEHGRLRLGQKAKGHLLVLLACMFGLKAWSFLLDIHRLVYSNRGITFGASYTDVHAYAVGLRILAILCVIAALTLLLNIFRRGWRLTIAAVALLVVMTPLVGVVFPALVQKLVVEPNELVKETPYIQYNIAMTRKAYGLDEVKEYDYDGRQELTYSDVASSVTLENIRLWDWRPLLQVYRQLQEMRLYYEFKDVDLDRYWLNGHYRQVMIAARELDTGQMQNKTWVNEKLQYTHGYGVVVSPVNEVTPEGLPRFFVSDVPPRTSIPELQITRPEIYFGELTDSYVIVNTRIPEFDYPRGDENAQTFYEGSGGVKLSNLIVRLAFAVRMQDPKILLSREITSDSRIMFYRNIVEQAKRIAPFLKYDKDPYLVIADGRLVWILDAYTTSDYFPYSTPTRGWGNYVRNSVKVTIDAYNGTMQFYIADPSDPIIRTYARIYPGLFVPLEQMPSQLRSHLRYPEDLFALQANVYAVYHMEDPTVFYNREDLWSVAQEIVGSETVPMSPYYLTMQMPNSNQPEFVLMLPFTPARRDNMIAWFAARNNEPHYGELIVYKFPKQTLTYGPMQIEARIDQDSEISQLLTLWSRSGSSVYRGNQLVIPINSGVLYVEPIYLQAAQGQMPELTRIVVAVGGRIAMGTTLDEALRMLFAVDEDESHKLPYVPREAEPIDPDNGTIAGLIQRAVELYNLAQERIRQGDWEGYGKFMKQLEITLQQLHRSVSPENIFLEEVNGQMPI